MMGMKICMVTSSYPKYEGDVTAPFIEAIASSVAAEGNEVHVLAPYHPDVRREPLEKGVRLHFFKYSPSRSLNIWGYAESLEADVRVKGVIYPMTPVVFISSFLALWRLTGRIKFDVMHGHWVIPNGPVAAIVAHLRRLPLVISLHGSDVFMAEQSGLLAGVARWCFRRASAITMPSEDLRQRVISLGAPGTRCHLVPYGVDPNQFTRIEGAAPLLRKQLGLPGDSPVVFSVGRMVYKKGFEYLIRAAPAILREHPDARIVIAGGGDLKERLISLVKQLGVEELGYHAGVCIARQAPTLFQRLRPLCPAIGCGPAGECRRPAQHLARGDGIRPRCRNDRRGGYTSRREGWREWPARAGEATGRVGRCHKPTAASTGASGPIWRGRAQARRE